ncbi:hypothetical protein KCX82_17000 [Clostridiales bacterium BAD-6]|uniref:Uncharacterized protein n=2 Tax=Sinanaerobacter chloroacetimidivorans TaxID=2818044 RepID=A0A8J7W626_9FIRM|nr:hypothetical protein [Sinanaerobacter chloroacetimidivorans]
MMGDKSGKTLQIEIFCSPEGEAFARAVGYGLEEEGLPYQVETGEEYSPETAYESSQQGGLGVSVLIKEGWISVYTRQLKEKRPLFYEPAADPDIAKLLGKNAARIVKNKPFLEIDSEMENRKDQSLAPKWAAQL